MTRYILFGALVLVLAGSTLLGQVTKKPYLYAFDKGVGECVSSGVSLDQAPQSSSVKPVQFKGIKSVLLNAYVDPYIPNCAEIAKRIEATAGKMLMSAGVLLDNKQRATFSIEVTLYPIEIGGFSDYAIIQVRTRLIEDVRLLRKPHIKRPIAADTWQTEAVDVLPRIDIEKYVLKRVEDQIEFFRSTLRAAEGRY